MKTNEEKLERIGNVVLNYNYYSGDDVYSEGLGEDFLLDIVKNNRESEYEKIIEASRNWSVMYHLSHIRENIVTWLPMNGTESVLEIGSGCGAITGMLSQIAGFVTCIDLSKKRSLINAYRHKECDNVQIVVGNFQDIEPEITEKYDYITLIGVFEYAGSYLGGNNPFVNMLEIAKKHLKEDGKLVIAIENKYGLKYFAGCKEDHTGKYYEGIEGYSDETTVRTFSRVSLDTMLRKAGLQSKFYYPYPDYKLPHTIYSDEHLPKKGELTTNIRNFDADRIITFNEDKVYDSLIDEGLFPVFSNSYVIIATKQEMEKLDQPMPLYVRYANDRAKNYRLSTLIFKDPDGTHHVYKEALHHSVNKHVREIYSNYETLCRMYEGTKLKPNKCTYIEGKESAPQIIGVSNKARDRVELQYLGGVTMEKYLDQLNEDKQYGHMLAVIEEYCKLINKVGSEVSFKMSEGFKNVFGYQEFEENYKCAASCNYDVIFSNIVFDTDDYEKNDWNVLDYEWMFHFEIPTKFIIYRALFYYEQNREEFGFFRYLEEMGKTIYSEFGFTDAEVEQFAEMEHNFQLHIINGMASMEVLKVIMPTATIRVDKVVEESMYLRSLNTPKVYYSHGDGFKPEDFYTILADVSDDNVVTLKVPITNNISSLRIDPTEYPCFINVREVRLRMQNKMEQSIERYLTNGYPASSETFVFDNDDSQFVVDIPRGAETLTITYQVKMLPEHFYQDISNVLRLRAEATDHRSFLDKVMGKLHIMKKEIIPPGYRYNQ